ncbi:MAG: strictosidine synthase family protein [Oleiphilus sp.]
MKKSVLLIVLVLVVLQGLRISQDAGIFRSVEQTVDYGVCEQLTGPVGAEDITIDRVSKVAYISADDRRAVFNDSELPSYPSGAIWRLDLSKPDSQAEKLEIDMMGDFHPHGIALRFSKPESTDQGRAIELYAISHTKPDQHEIVVFSILPSGELKVRRRITYPELIGPNDLVVVGKDQFYVSNDHGNPPHSVMYYLEDYLGLPLASVSYFDGVQGHIVISNLRYANGLALSDDQENLYVAETTAGRVSRYKQVRSRLGWKLDESLDVDMGVDNFEWDGSGNLLNAGHPKLFEFQAHMKDASVTAPSQVIQINVNSDPMSYETIYLNKGETLSGASVAAKWQDTLLVGSVFEPKFLRCKP